MNVAFCTKNKTSYDIATFSGLGDERLSTLRRALVCQKCKAQGYYRKESRDGKPACFGAYHQDNCEYKTKGSVSRLVAEVVEEVKAISTNGQVIDVAFGFHEADNSRSCYGPKPNIIASSASSQQHTQKPARKRNTSRGLKSLLRMLLNTDTFASSDIAINTGTGYPFKAKNLFIHFDDVSKERLGKWRGYWGVISHADPDISWLNVANEKEVSIFVSNLKDHVIKMCKIDSHEKLAGASVLVFGRLNISKNGKWYIKLDGDNSEHIYIEIL